MGVIRAVSSTSQAPCSQPAKYGMHYRYGSVAVTPRRSADSQPVCARALCSRGNEQRVDWLGVAGALHSTRRGPVVQTKHA